MSSRTRGFIVLGLSALVIAVAAYVLLGYVTARSVTLAVASGQYANRAGVRDSEIYRALGEPDQDSLSIQPLSASVDLHSLSAGFELANDDAQSLAPQVFTITMIPGGPSGWTVGGYGFGDR